MARRWARWGTVALASTMTLATLVGLGAVTERPAGAAVSLIPVARTATRYTSFSPGIGTPVAFSSPAVGNVTGSAAPEIVSAGMDGCVRVMSITGSTLNGCIWAASAAIQSSPLLVDWDGDGLLDIVVGTVAGGLFGFRGDGTRLFHFDTQGGVFATPAAGDVDGDGLLDLAISTWGQEVAVYRHNGTKLFARFIYDTSWSSPALADLDGDGRLEVIVGADMDPTNHAIGLPNIPAAGGYLWAFRRDGSDLPGFPRFMSSQVIWSSPAIVDLNQDGRLDIVVGTGENFGGVGRTLFAVDRFGFALPGWPVALPDTTMGSPAIADIDGDGRLDVVQQTGDGRISYIARDGAVWKQWCNRSFGACVHANFDGGPSIADVNGDGIQDVVATTEANLRVFSGATGALEADAALPYTWVPGSHPTIAHWGGDTYIVVSATTNANGNGAADVGDEHVISVFRTGNGAGRLAWPMFKNNSKRTGTYNDPNPPTVSGSLATSPAGSTTLGLDVSGVDAETGLAGVDVEVRQDAGNWVRYATRSGAIAVAGQNVAQHWTLYGLAGHSFAVRARGWDQAGNASAWVTIGSVAIAPSATRSQPFTSAYVAAATGTVSAVSSPVVQGEPVPAALVRGVAASAGGGGYTLDAYGGLHRFGGAPLLFGRGYWPGWDITRGVALDSSGAGGLIVDGFGGLHTFGAQQRPTSFSGYWPGWDVARGIALTPDSTLAAPQGYVVDAYGGLHPFGGAPAVRGTGYWPGWDIVRGIAVDPAGPGGYVLDGYGGIHPFGGAPARSTGHWWPGRDIAGGVALIAGGAAARGYVADGTGNVYPFGGAPAVQSIWRWPPFFSRGFSIAW